MPFNGSGVFQRVRNWVADATAGIKIRADYHDSEDDGFALGLSNCITKDGQTVVTQNIPMNSKRITGLADPVNPQDAATKASADAATNLKVSKTGDNMSGTLFTTGELWAGHGTAVGTVRFGAADGSKYLHWNDAAAGFTLAGGSFTVPGAITGTALWTATSANFGILYLGSSGVHNLSYNGTRYNLPNAPLGIGSPILNTDAARVDWAQASFNPVLGFTPVTQSSANRVYLGWDNINALVAQVDSTVLGAVAFRTDVNAAAGARVLNSRLTLLGDLSLGQGLADPNPGSVVVSIRTTSLQRLRWFQHTYDNTNWITIGTVG